MQGVPRNKKCIRLVFTLPITHVKFTVYHGHKNVSHVTLHYILIADKTDRIFRLEKHDPAEP